MLQVQVAWEDV